MIKKNIKVILCVCAILGLLAALAVGRPNRPQDDPSQSGNSAVRYTMNFTCFDTVSYVYTYAGDSDDAFADNCEEVWSVLAEYHKLFDIYNEYSGINNLCTLNKNAGGEPISVDERLIDFLLYAKELYALTGGEMNVMMGSVLSLWHDAREEGGYVPSSEELAEAAKHMSIDLLEINEEEGTIRITDKNARIDVGALGKGYATEIAAKALENRGISSYVLNIGGNIRIIGKKPNGEGWKTGIKDPADTSNYSKKIIISDTSCVTSGDYERYFIVDGVKYHHIIDKDTLVPANYFSSVTVITKNSGLADALSTALFSMSYEDGLALVRSIGGVEVLWILPDGSTLSTEGFAAIETK